MGVVPKEEVKQTKLEETLKKAVTEPVKRELVEDSEPQIVPDINNYQYNEVKRSLQEFIEAYQKYLECKDKLDDKKASLLIYTDWGEIFEGKPTVAMKDAYVHEVTMEQRIENRKLYLDKLYKEELYKLEVKRFEKN